MDDAYEKLATHLSCLGMGMPYREGLLEILKENLTPAEATVLLLFPTRVAPLNPVKLDEIASQAGIPREELEELVESLAERGWLFSGETDDGQQGYALQQVGFGFPQLFFWKGEDTPSVRDMATMVTKYFNRQVTEQAFSGSETKPYRYIPVRESVDQSTQAVFPYQTMEKVIEQAHTFALASCPCRMMTQLRGHGCDHPLEVCMKFDELAQYLIDRGFGREITREEAMDVLRKSEEAGLVHFVDNAVDGIKHNCNCCGCACWNVGSIKRRKIPRDILMATYFIRDTDEDECIACGNCVEICPVDAVAIKDNAAAVDQDWCIGCGVCISHCPTGAAKLKQRTDKTELPLPDFEKLHQNILKEKHG